MSMISCRLALQFGSCLPLPRMCSELDYRLHPIILAQRCAPFGFFRSWYFIEVNNVYVNHGIGPCLSKPRFGRSRSTAMQWILGTFSPPSPRHVITHEKFAPWTDVSDMFRFNTYIFRGFSDVRGLIWTARSTVAK